MLRRDAENKADIDEVAKADPGSKSLAEEWAEFSRTEVLVATHFGDLLAENVKKHAHRSAAYSSAPRQDQQIK